MLNYVYGVLQSQLQIEAIAAGYDPTLGIMHHGYKGSPALVFDLMEPRRPKGGCGGFGFRLARDVQWVGFRDQVGRRGEVGAAVGEEGLSARGNLRGFGRF
jgi:hypothetical protein